MHPSHLPLADQRKLTKKILDLSEERVISHTQLSFEDKEFILRNYEYLTIITLALALKVPARQVRRYLYSQGLRKSKERPREVMVWHDA